MTFDLLTYTKNIMKELDEKGYFITHLLICYKLILYYENNIGDITSVKNDELMSWIDKIYQEYLNSDKEDIFDELIMKIFV